MHAPELNAPDQFIYQRKKTRDSDEHAESLVAWDQIYDQLTPGGFQGNLTEMWFQGIQIFRETTNRAVVQNGTCWEDCLTIGVPVAMSGNGLFSKQSFTTRNVFTFQSEDEFSLTSPEEMDIIGLALPKANLRQCLDQETLAEMERLFPATPTVLQPRPEQLGELRACLTWILDPANFEPELLRFPNVQRTMHASILENVLSILRTATPAAQPSPSFKGRCHLVSQAVDYVMSRVSQPPSVNELCIKLNVSRRMLNYSFQEVLGTNPVSHLRSLRLNGVRRDLREHRQGEVAIRDIAAKWGFWHLPRFAGEYRALFGELPSATVAKGQRPVGKAA